MFNTAEILDVLDRSLDLASEIKGKTDAEAVDIARLNSRYGGLYLGTPFLVVARKLNEL